jgi:hypothetical protein
LRERERERGQREREAMFERKDHESAPRDIPRCDCKLKASHGNVNRRLLVHQLFRTNDQPAVVTKAKRLKLT